MSETSIVTGPMPAVGERTLPPLPGATPADTSAIPPEPAVELLSPGPQPASRRLRVLVGTVLGALLLLRQPASEFVYDAADYFAGARALLDGGSAFEDGGLALRGVLTAFLYLPAALVAHLGGAELAGAAVLAQNAVLIAVIGVLLLPRLVGIWRPVTPVVVLTSAVGTAVTVAGFAPFPLSDLSAAALLLTTVVALDHRSSRWSVVAGLAAGAAVNIRPATLLPLAAVGVAVLVARRWSAGWCAVGAAVGLAPQFLLNRWHGSPGWLPVPEQTAWLSQLQAYYAAHLVRYDTVVGAGPETRPSLFWCSPEILRATEGRLPGSPGALAGTYLTHLPEALVFSAQKVGAALHWPLSTPYLTPAPVLNGLFAVVITAVTVAGAVAVLRRTCSRAGVCPSGRWSPSWCGPWC